jgi:hypothetical protein
VEALQIVTASAPLVDALVQDGQVLFERAACSAIAGTLPACLPAWCNTFGRAVNSLACPACTCCLC